MPKFSNDPKNFKLSPSRNFITLFFMWQNNASNKNNSRQFGCLSEQGLQDLNYAVCQKQPATVSNLIPATFLQA